MATSPIRLYLNNGDGSFTEVASEWGVAVSHRGTGAAVADFNNDGWLDLFVTSRGPAGNPASGSHKLYRNDGTHFTDVTASAGLAGPLVGISGFAIKFVDMDNDGDQDLIWIGDFGTSKYFVNNGNGTFTDFTAASGTSLDGTEMGVTVLDLNEDGLFDFYVTTIGTNNLYINQGGNVFVEQAGAASVASGGWGWGAVSIDMNHDTRIDLLSTTQSGRQYAWKNVSSTPQAPQFLETALSIGLVSPVLGRGLSNFDYDNDGDQDLVIFPFGDEVVLYRNDLAGPDTHWLRVLLDNGCSATIPADGVGAVVKATVGTRTWMRPIEAGNNYLSNSELSAHFGLGAASTVDTLSVVWPDGQVTTMTNVAADSTITIRAPTSRACSKSIGAERSAAAGLVADARLELYVGCHRDRSVGSAGGVARGAERHVADARNVRARNAELPPLRRRSTDRVPVAEQRRRRRNVRLADPVVVDPTGHGRLHAGAVVGPWFAERIRSRPVERLASLAFLGRGRRAPACAIRPLCSVGYRAGPPRWAAVLRDLSASTDLRGWTAGRCAPSQQSGAARRGRGFLLRCRASHRARVPPTC
ncbi:MAG: CRTAC1 family protein [Planctomycetota bacterium]